MRVALLYLDGCPNWRLADERIAQALASTGHTDVLVELVEITTEEQAAELGFAGSPTILIDGRDRFAGARNGGGLSCRLYSTSDGVAGCPTISQLEEAVSGREPRSP